MVRLHYQLRGEVWRVDFRVSGVRYRMTTGETDRTAAEGIVPQGFRIHDLRHSAATYWAH